MGRSIHTPEQFFQDITDRLVQLERRPPGGGGGGGGSTDWADITGKPVTFPSSWSEVAGKPTTFPSDWSTLAGKPSTFPPPQATTSAVGGAELATQAEADAGTDAQRIITPATLSGVLDAVINALTIPWDDVTGKPTSFPSDWSAITGKPSTFPSTWATVSGKPTTFPSTWATVSGKPSTFPPSGHTHPSSQITDFATAVPAAVPAASASVAGKVELATEAEIWLGTDPARTVSIEGLLQAFAEYSPRTGRAGFAQATSDWNTTTETGFYFSGSAANSPAAGAFFGLVYGLGSIDAAHSSGDFLGFVQVVRAWDPSTNTFGLEYRRSQGFAGTWSAWTAESATPTARGTVELATSAEVAAGTDNERAVTPASLLGRTSTTSRTGLVELATNAESIAGTDAVRAVTPAGLQAALDAAGIGDAVQWSAIEGKPSTFPTTWSEVAGKPTTFPAAWSDITGKPSTFPPSAHTHTASNITDFATAVEQALSNDSSLTMGTTAGATDLRGTSIGIGAGSSSVSIPGYVDVGQSLEVGTEVTAPRIRLTSTSDASLSSTGHAFQVGSTGGENMRIDPNEIQAVDNGAASALYLNNEGGAVTIGNSGSATTLNGASVYFPNVPTASSQADTGATWRVAGIASSNGLTAMLPGPLGIGYMRHMGVYGSNQRLYLSTDPSGGGGNYIGVGKDTAYGLWMNANNGQTFMVTHAGVVHALGVYGNNITQTRRAQWIGSNGEMGYASSSREEKQDLGPASLDVEALRQIPVHHYHYLAELAKRDEDPDYRVATEIGTFAEDVHELGLWQFVQYEGRGEDAVPVGIHYEMLSLAALSLAQQLADKVDGMEARLAALEANLAG